MATTDLSQVHTALLPFSSAFAASLSCYPTIQSLDRPWEVFYPIHDVFPREGEGGGHIRMIQRVMATILPWYRTWSIGDQINGHDFCRSPAWSIKLFMSRRVVVEH